MSFMKNILPQFGPSTGETAATTGQQGAIPAIGQGLSNLQSGANFFSTVLNGNQANTRALLQPDINRINESTQGAVQGASTLMPRGGGRFATLFQQPFAAQRQISDLFSGLRSNAAGGLASIGGQQAQIGTQNATNLFDESMKQRQYQNQNFGQLFTSALPLLAAPFTGGASLGAYGIPGVGGK